MLLMDGKAVASKIRGELKGKVADLKERGVFPRLAVLLVGDDEASRVYAQQKRKSCEAMGIGFELHLMAGDSSQDDVIAMINRLNGDERVTAVMVEMPLPKHIDRLKVQKRVSPRKDVDGANPVNLGLLMAGGEGLFPNTPRAVMAILDFYGVELEGKNVVVVGRSNTVGKPVALMLLERNATVTVCHSRTKNLGDVVRGADVVVAAVGKAGMITSNMVFPGAVVVDVGINVAEDGSMVGDVDFEGLQSVAGSITPVPGGVGPVTNVLLLDNVVRSAVMQVL